MPRTTLKTMLAGGVCAFALTAGGMAGAQTRDFDVPAGDLSVALDAYARQSGVQIIYRIADVTGVRTQGARGPLSSEEALAQLLEGTRFEIRRDPSGAIAIADASDPQSGSAAGDGADGTVAALIVTAQKREENIQDVPIAMSAFTQEELTRSQVAAGPDLMTQVPNMTFTKTNFTSYSIQIRGIGTQAISATVDPAVAVAFNNTPFLRAHFFEQEFYDLERVEVLRGPQGTLYGRNATAGVVNLLSAKPKFHFEAKASADVSNYSSHRLEGMLNLPLVEDKAALRIAGAWTKRDGYVTNINTGKPIDGRDLWSTRVSFRVDPTEKIRANFVWEHFEEDDDRLRSGKQTCKRAVAPTSVLGVPVSQDFFGGTTNGVLADRRYLDQGCDPASMYSPDAFGVPDGLTLPFYLPMGQIGGSVFGNYQWDIYASATQSHDLRVIESEIEPHYRASADTAELNVDYDLTDYLTLSSQTGFNRDFIFSSEDYNRFNTKPGAFTLGQTFNPNGRLKPSDVGLVYGPGTGDLFGTPCTGPLDIDTYYICYVPQIFCDPQIGCSDKLLLMDLATGRSRQFSQEIRLASSLDGPFNFSLGANYLRYKTLEDYYVFINTITETMAAQSQLSWTDGPQDNHDCLRHGFNYLSPFISHSPQNDICGYIDTNPITDLNGQGHNYFRSQNPYRLQSYAIFGEAYYDLTPELKLTAGLRWTVDRKRFDSIPSEVLIASYGYPTIAQIKQEWREPTGRLVLTWTPHPSFTDQTMVYGSYAHGYKAGGANPPGAALLRNRGGDIAFPIHPATFDPEFVNAYELGTKNTLLDGRLTANLTGFYYDYTGYQISEIVDRSAINLNFDAKVWGLELETDWRPLENLRFGLKVGYEDTQVADGQSAVDLMDRTAGHDDWMVVKPFPTQASNCIMPKYVVATLLEMADDANLTVENACTFAYLGRGGELLDPATADTYIPNPTHSIYYGTQLPEGYPGFNPETAPNGGAGFSKDLSGNALPNAPHYTVTLTTDYTVPLPQDWLLTLHGDFYQQSEAWTRIFNMPGYDKLKAYNNINLAAIFTNEDRGWTVMAYIKNILDKDNITGAFLNSDDTGLTTNVFLNEPRLYGLRVTKNWTDSPWWSAHANHSGYYPLRVELGGYHGRASHDHAWFIPRYADLFPDDLQFPTYAQNDLGSSNGGEIRFTYQPTASSWNISAAVRYGRASDGTHKIRQKDVAEVCLYNGKYCHIPSNGRPTAASVDNSQKYGWNQYYELTTQSEEAHTFADFTVGKDAGLGGAFGRDLHSSLSAGAGYAHFKSTSDAVMHGSPDMYFPANIVGAGYQITSGHTHQFSDTVHADREFEGAGPELNWDVSVPLAGDAAGGFGLDVGLAGVVLFGKQKAQLRGHLEGSYGTGAFDPTKYTTQTYNAPLNIAPREKSATVPGLRGNIGLSYTAEGLKVSGGYRVERYYDAIDGGWEERKTYDRGFEGPYMKVSIGFGG